MDGSGGGRSNFPTGGQIILSALQKSNNNIKSQTQSHESLTMDPAVAEVGPTLLQQPWLSSSLSSYEHDRFLQSFRQTQNPWSSSSGNNYSPANTSQHDDIWRSGFQSHKPEMRIGSIPLSFLNSDSLMNSNRVDSAVAASDLLSRLNGLNDNTGLGIGNGSFAGLDSNRLFELQGNSSNLSVQRMGHYGNSEYDRRGNGGLDRQEHGFIQKSSRDDGFNRQFHGEVHRTSGDGGLSGKDRGMVYRDGYALFEEGSSRQDHNVVHRSLRDGRLSSQDHDGGLSRQDHGVVCKAGYTLYDEGLSRQDHDVVHRSLRDGRLRSQDPGVVQRPLHETQRAPPGFPSNPQGGRNFDVWNTRIFEQNVRATDGSFGELNNRAVTSIENERSRTPSHVNNKAHSFLNSRVTEQFDRPGLPTGSNLHSVRASGIEASLQDLHAEVDNIANENGYHKKAEMHSDVDGSNDKSDQKKSQNIRDKYARSDTRGNWLLSQKMRNQKRLMICRSDIGILNAPLLAIFESLIPAAEEKAKQKQLLALLERLVTGEWPEAKLYLYGSCANSFDVSKSDIDVCLAINDSEINKSEFLLRLAEILESNHLHNVQALTRARVPIVKLKDPVTGISCDICMNNVLAVVNTKLLRDYAEIDGRLRQLAFLVKHWAKSRAVNETYQGTLSSYAYVLMCIHFLQQRKPAILPCLQGMEPTYSVTANDVKCAYFDRVDKLYSFGSRNKESISQLLWGFFTYWAYAHDYANNAISVRTGTIISKQSKDWTTRVGNDRHLICIEDPFQTSHDLGRVVDKYSIKVVREEFERAAHIMQHDQNPSVKLFEPYVPEREPFE